MRSPSCRHAVRFARRAHAVPPCNASHCACSLMLLLSRAHIRPCDVLAQSSVPYTVVFDSYMTPAAGAQGLLTVQHLLASCRRSMAAAQDRRRAQPSGACARHPLSRRQVPRARHAAGSFPSGRRARSVRPWRALSRAWRRANPLRFRRAHSLRLGRCVYEIQRPVSDLSARGPECVGCRHRRAARARRCDRRARRGARTSALSRGVAVLRIAHGRRRATR